MALGPASGQHSRSNGLNKLRSSSRSVTSTQSLPVFSGRETGRRTTGRLSSLAPSPWETERVGAGFTWRETPSSSRMELGLALPQPAKQGGEEKKRARVTMPSDSRRSSFCSSREESLAVGHTDGSSTSPIQSVTEQGSISPPISSSRKGGAYAGPSRGEGPAPEHEKPVKAKCDETFVPDRRARIFGNKNVVGMASRKKLRKEVPGVDSELLGHLLRKFAFVPRTAELMVVMSRTAQAFYKGFDLSEWTELELYKTTVMTITAAMDIPDEEEACRQHLKSKSLGEAREAHAKMMKGQLGTVKNIFGVGRTAVLPGKGSG